MRVNMLRLRCTMDCQPLTKKGKAHHRTTGVARANSIRAQALAENRCCMGIEGRNAETISASMGTASATLIQSRLVILTSSSLESSAVTSRGSSAIPQIGQEPGPSRTISGCIGQVYSERLAGAGATAGSSAMPHFGQLPGPVCLTSGCIGQVYSPCGPVFAAGCGGAASGLACTYFSGLARKFAAQP